jgi:hypothetical protein
VNIVTNEIRNSSSAITIETTGMTETGNSRRKGIDLPILPHSKQFREVDPLLSTFLF